MLIRHKVDDMKRLIGLKFPIYIYVHGQEAICFGYLRHKWIRYDRLCWISINLSREWDFEYLIGAEFDKSCYSWFRYTMLNMRYNGMELHEN